MHNPYTFTGLWRSPVHLLTLGFGSGLSPVAPGTAGTLLAALLFIPLSMLPLWAYAIFVMLCTVIGFRLCDLVAQDLGQKDPGCIVWDEMVGFWVAIAPLYPYTLGESWHWLLMGFFVFRGLDIAKTWPMSWGEAQEGGIGIMLDDLLAGIMTAIWLYALMFLQQAGRLEFLGL